MKRCNVVIKCNSELQLICAISASMCRYSIGNTKFYILGGQINGNQLRLNFLKSEQFLIINSELELINITKDLEKLVIISASHFPYSLIRQIGVLKVTELIRVEEGIGSYGNLYTKVIGLFRHNYGKLVFRHVFGIMVAKILETLGIQKCIFAFHPDGAVNVVFAKNFRHVVFLLASRTECTTFSGSLVFPTEKLESYMEKIKFTDFTPKYHPAWGLDIASDDFNKTGVERIIANSPEAKFVISEFSSSMLYLQFYSGCVGICIDKNNGRFLNKRQKQLFHKYCVVVPI